MTQPLDRTSCAGFSVRWRRSEKTMSWKRTPSAPKKPKRYIIAKSFAFVITALMVRRMLKADTWTELVVYCAFVIIFVFLSVYFVFESQFRRNKLFRSIEGYALRNGHILNYLRLILGCVVFEVILIFYIPDGPIFKMMRTPLVIIFCCAIVFLLVVMIKTKKYWNGKDYDYSRRDRK